MNDASDLKFPVVSEYGSILGSKPYWLSPERIVGPQPREALEQPPAVAAVYPVLPPSWALSPERHWSGLLL